MEQENRPPNEPMNKPTGKAKKLWDFTCKCLRPFKTYLGGLALIIGGALMITYSHVVLLNVLVFCIGVLLIYYGMQTLNLRRVTNFIEQLFRGGGRKPPQQ